MAWEVDASEFETATDAGSKTPKAGTYHVTITDYDDTMDKVESIIVRFEVLDGTVPGQAGKEHTEFFRTESKKEGEAGAKATKWLRDRIATLGMAAGVVKPGSKATLSDENMVGTDLVIRLEDNEYTAKDGTKKQNVRIPFSEMWPTDHAEVADVPKNEAFRAGKRPADDVPFETDDEFGDI